MKEDATIGFLIIIYIIVCITLFFPGSIEMYHEDRSEKIIKKIHTKVEGESKHLFIYKVVDGEDIGESVSEDVYNKHEEGQMYHFYDFTKTWIAIAVICFLIFALICAAGGVNIFEAL